MKVYFFKVPNLITILLNTGKIDYEGIALSYFEELENNTDAGNLLEFCCWQIAYGSDFWLERMSEDIANGFMKKLMLIEKPWYWPYVAYICLLDLDAELGFTQHITEYVDIFW